MRPEKASIVEDIAGKLNASPFLFVADYTGLKVSQFAELRNRLHGVGSRCHVVKNTFLRRAVTDAGLPEIADLQGQTAIVVGDKDVAATAKVLKTFATEFKKPTVTTGIVDRLVVSPEQISAIADLPSRDVLLATLLGVLQAPAGKLVRVLNEPASSLARVLQAKAEKEDGGAAPASETSEAAAA
jgi:large subunit ribosomal protein L10